MNKNAVVISGIIPLLLVIITIILKILPFGNADLWYTLSIYFTALVFVPLFFVYEYKMVGRYKWPCYLSGAIFGIILILGGLHSGTSHFAGAPNFYSSGFILICYMVVMLLYKPGKQFRAIIVTQTILMVAAMFVVHLLDNTL